MSAGPAVATSPNEARRAADRSSAWSHDAAGKPAVGELEFACERVAIWAGWAAMDVTIVLLPAALGSAMPRPVVGHGTFDAEQASVRPASRSATMARSATAGRRVRGGRGSHTPLLHSTIPAA